MRSRNIIRNIFNAGIGFFCICEKQAAFADTHFFRKSLFAKDMDDFKKNHHIQGTIALSENGVMIHTITAGNADIKNPCTAETQYPIGSLTKQFTAAALLRVFIDLYCKNNDLNCLQEYLHKPIIALLKPDDEIWGENGAPKWASLVTGHHLLSNTSGIVDFIYLPEYKEFRNKPHSRREVLALFTREDCSFTPGSRYAYSNSNFFLVGVLIERLTGKTLSQYMQATFFAPLQMSHTFLPEHDTVETLHQSEKYPKLALGYAYSLKDATKSFDPLSKKDYERAEHNQGDGGLISTTADLIRWNHALHETQKILPKEAKKLMFTPPDLASDQENNYGYRYGYGIKVTQTDGQVLYSHKGYVPGYLSVMFYDPAKKLTFVHLSNIAPDDDQYLNVKKTQTDIQLSGEAEAIKQEKFKRLAEEYPMAEAQLEKYRLIDPKDLVRVIQFKPSAQEFELSSISSLKLK